jgi:hypothetical protein
LSDPIPNPVPHSDPAADPIPLPQKEAAILDVHPPHESVHSWRDFFIHIATIVIGLLIAIGLEQTVEYLHHRHLLHQAHENLREEIQDNQRLLAMDRRYLESNRQTVLRNIDTLHQIKADPKQTHSALRFPWQWSSPSAAAWNTARDTGALALMPYEQVQGYSLLYGQQDRVNEQANIYIQNQNHIAVPLVGTNDASTLSAMQIDDLIRGCATSNADITLLETFMNSLDRNYTSALNDL